MSRPKINTVYLYLGHLIEADKLPRHVSKKTFYEHFVKYYEEQWHEPWTGNMETVMETFRVLEATADKVGLESPSGIGHRWKFGGTPEDEKRSLLMFRDAMLFFPKGETLKTWLDKLITDRNWIKAPPSPELEPEPQPQPETKERPRSPTPSPEPSEELSERRTPSPKPSEQLEPEKPETEEPSETRGIDPLVHYFAHMIETEALPKPRAPPAGSMGARSFKLEDARRMYAKEFLEDFREWCDDNGYRDFKPRGVMKLQRRVDTLFSGYYNEVEPGWQMVKPSEVEPGQLARAVIFPEPEVLKKWIKRYIEIIKRAGPTVPLTGSVYFVTRDNVWRVHYKKDYYGTYKTEKEAKEELAKLNTLTPEELAVEKKRFEKKRRQRKKQQVNPSKDPFQDVVREYDKLKAEIIKRQDELSEMRSNLKSLGDKKRKFEIEEEERV